jgi:hypothetical protein
MSILPTEITHHCLSFLSEKDLFNASRVSHSWDQIVTDIFYRKLGNNQIFSKILRCSNLKFLEKIFLHITQFPKGKRTCTELQTYQIFNRMITLWSEEKLDRFYQAVTDKMHDEYGWDWLTASQFQARRQIHQFRYFDEGFLKDVLCKPGFQTPAAVEKPLMKKRKI